MPDIASRRIVITGATGLIGAEIVRRLAQRGDRVVALVRDVQVGRRNAPGAAEYLKWSDAMSDGEWRKAIDGADGVIHLAGSPIGVRWSPEVKRKARESRIMGTRHIVDAMRQAAVKPSVMVSASAVGYYGTAPVGTLTENSAAGSDFLATLCADWEAEARKAEALGVRVALLRTGIVLDPKGGALKKLLTPFKLFIGGPLGSGRQPFPWIHIDDEVGIVLWALDNDRVSGPLNGSAPGVVSNREFSSVLGRVMHRPSLFPVPEFVLRLLLAEGASVVTQGQFAVPERVMQLGYRFKFPEAEGALRNLLST